ncbi:hypothetical protein N8295_03935 [Pseudomonadales bacterium]|nr:hypothetical protein [Pseudomonadales bacterium]
MPIKAVASGSEFGSSAAQQAAVTAFFYSHAPKRVGVPSNIDLKSINLSETFLISASDLQ